MELKLILGVFRGRTEKNARRTALLGSESEVQGGEVMRKEDSSWDYAFGIGIQVVAGSLELLGVADGPKIVQSITAATESRPLRAGCCGKRSSGISGPGFKAYLSHYPDV